MRVRRSIVSGLGLAVAATSLTVPSASLAQSGGSGGDTTAQTTPFQMVEGKPLENRFAQPEDRYALASGCYTVEVTGEGHLAADGSFGDEAGAAPLHFQATDLGTYLLAANEGPDTSVEGAWWDVRSYYAADGSFAAAPSESTEWTVIASGDDPDAEARGSNGQDYELTSGSTTLAPVRFHHVADDDRNDDDANGTACANWPEVTTNTSGPPAETGRGAGDRVEGFFEAHIHGMAYEFLGGELRCGQPWHRYGVEYALPDCREDEGKPFNGPLEVALAGQDPQESTIGYDPVGWPTFNYWPKHNTLTHEQFYWKWLERAHHGGLRIFTNLFVENSALCELYPLKENSCNEMDSVRLQARRIHELQAYIDAQNGGPGEGWFRIVTTPAQARRVINDGRLAVVLGIEVSELFDCREILDVPQCTAEEIDDRLAEVYDMGVRQMELLNKFDSALAGVTGDGGETGVIVNQGQRKVSQHYWNMLTCEEVDPGPYEGHQHDKTQVNFGDDFPDEQPEIDELAGIVFSQFGNFGGVLPPAYPPSPHCNTRGLTDLGRHVIKGMYERGMVFDPDHMSALAQREALDYVEQLVAEETAVAAAEGRPAVLPSLISSHSWGNDVIYQRIIANGGHVAPRTGDANRFVDYWLERRAWHDDLAPAGTLFGMGYGADTNGLGGQPGPRGDAAVRLAYDGNGWQAPIGDVTIFQHTSGVHTYDINTDGVAMYALFADWFQELRFAADEKAGAGAGDRIITDMLNAAEDYLRMWERNVYGPNQCVEDQSGIQTEDVNALLGQNFEQFQENIGAPASRDGAVYTYCAEGANGETVVLDVVFDAAGNAVSVSPSTSGLEVAPAPLPTLGDDGHVHDPDAAGLPATGGGLTALAMLLGLSGLGLGAMRRRRG